MSTRFYEFGPFRIDKLNHVLLRDGAAVPLKPKVFDTLVLLVESRDRVLDKNELMSRLWPDTVVEEANLSQNIYLLRKVLGEVPEAYIATHPKRGYRFVASVNEIADSNADQIVEPENHGYPVEFSWEQPLTLAKALIRYERQAQNRKVIAVAFLLCFLGLSLAFALSSFRNKNGSTSIAHAARVESVAVLPFKSLGSDAIDEVQGFGMADTLITQLSRKFVVRPTSAVRKFQSLEQDPVAAGRELQVDAVLDTNVQRVGNKLRVTMQLVRVSDGSTVWAGKFDQEANDLLAVQDRLSEEVAQALIPQLTGEEQKLISKRYTENAEAYQLYMMGRYHWSKTNRVDWNKAIEYFNKAIEKDPTYALAYTGLADCYLSIVVDSSISKTEAIPKANKAVMVALQLDDNLSEAHVSLGRVKALYDWDWSNAEIEFKRAIELNPNSASAHREYAGYLTYVLRTNEAVAEAKRARELDPLSQLTNFQVEWALISADRYDEAIELSRQVVGTFPHAYLWIAWANIGKEQYDEAISNLQQRISLLGDDPITSANLGYAYAMSGKKSEAKRVLAQLLTLYKQHQASSYLIAVVYAGLHDVNQTFAWLEKAYHERSRSLATGLNVNPVWDRFRSDPRFADLLRRVGLPQ
jgi:DNA-binding winged helix-turn-helix (wHTH) protein/TolB-like protein/Tfp pilus assembly protein PilF